MATRNSGEAIGGKEKKTTVAKEQCEHCPLKSGTITIIERGFDSMSRKLSCIEQRCESRPPLCTTAINTKVGHRVFWPIVTLFVVIVTSIIGFSMSSSKEYQVEHSTIHQQIEIEKKRVNDKIIEKVNQIAIDVEVIKAKIEKGG